MGGASTVYDVKVRYTLDDRAGKGLSSLASEADRAAKKTLTLGGALEALGAYKVITEAKHALIDFNSEIQQMKIGLQTVMNMNLHMPIEKARIEADKLFDTFQQMAKKSPVTTKDFMEMATAISPAVAMAGGGPEKLKKLTAGAITAGLATGNRPDLVAMDVQEMLMGNVTRRNRLGNQLLGSIGMDHNEFNAKSGKDRAVLVEKMLDSEPLKKAAEAFGATFAGQTSTFKDNLQIALGQVGMPLMTSMTEEVKKWNTWIEKHPKTIQKIVTQIAGVMKDAFGFVAKTVGFLIEHRDMLMAIGKIFLVFKGAQIATNVFKSFADGVGNFVSSIKNATSTLRGAIGGEGGGGLVGGFKSLIGILSGAGGVIPIFAGLVTGLSSFMSVLDDLNNDEKSRARRGEFDEALGEGGKVAQRLSALDELTNTLTYGNNGKVGTALGRMDPMTQTRTLTEQANLRSKFADPEFAGSILRGLSDTMEKNSMGSYRNMNDSDIANFGGRAPNEMFSKLWADNDNAKQLMGDLDQFYLQMGKLNEDQKQAIFKAAFPEQFGKPNMDTKATDNDGGWNPSAGKGPNINVTIQKIEVASEDPDRFVFGMVKAVEQITKNPTQAASTIAGGF